MSLGGIRIEEAGEADVPAILEMIQGLAEYEKLTHLVRATEEKLRETLFGPKPGAEVLLAFVEEECAGMALFFPNYSTFLAQPGIFLEDLYVKPHLRGKGAGFALLRRLAQLALERNCGRVEWEVLDWNEPSIGFYKALGALPLDEWTRYRLSGESLARLADSNLRKQKRKKRMKRSAHAKWQGDLRTGKGLISTDSGVLSDSNYSFSTRFENGIGTNPEELLAAAHAGCFTMALSNQLGQAGITAESLETKCTITVERLESGFEVTESHLELKAKIPGASQEAFDKATLEAKAGCPVSKLYKTNITLTATLEA